METRRIKKIIFLSLILVAFFGIKIPQTFSATVSKPANNLGLVGYWSFNEGTSTIATDFSGSGNTGTLNGFSAPASATSGWTNGKLGNALIFDGTDDYVTLGNSSSLNPTTGITISAWFYNSNPSDNNDTIISTDNGGTVQYRLRIQFDTGAMRFTVDGATGVDDINGTTIIQANTWYHVVGTYDGSNLNLYVNGRSDATPVAETGTIAAGDAKVIGRRTSGADNFSGKIDEVRIYGRALTSAEVTKLYNSGLRKINGSQNVISGSTLQNSLLGMWSFNGPDLTDKVYDASGLGNNGYHLGRATSTVKTIGKVGQGLSFDGSTDYIDMGNPVALRPTSNVMTMSAWVKPSNTAGGNGYILSKENASVDYFFRQQGVSGAVRCSFEGVNAGDAPTGTLVNGEWTFLTCVFDGTNNIVYKNGVSVLSGAAVTSTFSDNGNSVNIGRKADGTGFFPGAIDEVRSYNRALTASEVKQLYLAGKR